MSAAKVVYISDTCILHNAVTLLEVAERSEGYSGRKITASFVDC
jgi:hypothetical protein